MAAQPLSWPKAPKFNSRKEETLGKEFWEVWKDHTFRFCFNCTQCSTEIVLRTDPKCSHLAVEVGAPKFYSHDFIPWLPPRVEEKEKLVPCTSPNWQEKREEVLVNRKRKIEEVGDAMKSLDFNPAVVDVIKYVKVN
ncbi:coiled-coil domain-containing protein 94 homolog [Prunus yedoensis var. nudiflora]|uniref:Coiled-coil domain-containing protein 94 homolog n=1 Tax=Prunus yedoensis var. nudiflora TaxID=2094558 RepID=A0A314XNN3_PRUYE|nr:coiled-coil domain-containing protein 94 homolog [Prunus yedoensis var. nudiflora]